MYSLWRLEKQSAVPNNTDERKQMRQINTVGMIHVFRFNRNGGGWKENKKKMYNIVIIHH